MNDDNDIELLRAFAERRDEQAFAEVVKRRLALVYSTALRHCGKPHAAEEVTQSVFILLARKAGRLSPRIVLSGWLYQATLRVAANCRRAENRRQHREQQAFMNRLPPESSEASWLEIAPILDAAMARLSPHDRDAIVLRFFENKPLRIVGQALGTSEDAARVRVRRALEKLRGLMSVRGVTVEVSLLGAVLAVHSVQGAPEALAKTVAASALQAATATVAVGLGTPWLSVLGKPVFFSWMAPILGVIASLPGLAFAAWIGHLERGNYRDRQGFRSRLHRLTHREFLWVGPLIALPLVLISSIVLHSWGLAGVRLLVTSLLGWSAAISARLLLVVRNRYRLAMFIAFLLLLAGNTLPLLG